MKNLVIIGAIVLQLVSCNSKKNDQTANPVTEGQTSITAKNDSVVNVKIYEGVLPCADCSGIETVLKIDEGDGTMENYKFELKSIYKGKQPEKSLTEKGNFNYERGLENDNDGTVYVLNSNKPESEQIYYGLKSSNQDTIYFLNNKREIIKSKLPYFLLLKK